VKSIRSEFGCNGKTKSLSRKVEILSSLLTAGIDHMANILGLVSRVIGSK
jgi:hypothetical protein